MKRISNDRQALGGKGTFLLLIIVIALLLLGLTMAQPLIVDQKVSPGDTLTYSLEVTGGTEGEVAYSIESMTLTDLDLEQTDHDDAVSTYSVDWERTDGMLAIDGSSGNAYYPFDIMETILDNPGDFEKTMSLSLVGLTPMAVDVYTGDIGGDDVTVKTKMGTAIPVEITVTDGSTTTSMELVNTNICWISAPMTLL